MDRRGRYRWSAERSLQFTKILERQLKWPRAGKEHLKCGQLVLVCLDPGPKILHFDLRFFHRRGIETGIEHIVDGVTVNGLLVLLLDFQNTAAKCGLKEGCDGMPSELFGGLVDLFSSRILGPELLFRSADLSVCGAGVEQVVGEIRKRLATSEILQFRELDWREVALKSGQTSDQCD